MSNQIIVTRDNTKIPFMAIMYGGTKKAVASGGTSGDFNEWCNANNLDVEKTAELAVASVKEAMGSDFVTFIASVEHTVRQWLLLNNKDNIKYKHTDGFTVLADNSSNTEEVESFSFVMSDALYDNEGNEMVAAKTVDFGCDGIYEFASENQSSETVRKFMVNYVQGIDALIARTTAKNAALSGIRNYTSIHDCFRCHPADVELLRQVIADTYKELFIDQDQVTHLEAQIGAVTGYKDEDGKWVSYTRKPNFLTIEMLYSTNAYYFGK